MNIGSRDKALRKRLDRQRAAQFEADVENRALALVRQHDQEVAQLSPEAGVVAAAEQVRDRLLFFRDLKIKEVRAATRLGKWLVRRKIKPDIRFYSDSWIRRTELEAGLRYFLPFDNEEGTPDGTILYGWVIDIDVTNSARVGRLVPEHSPLNISRIVVDRQTGITGQEPEDLWYSINPGTKSVRCFQVQISSPFVSFAPSVQQWHRPELEDCLYAQAILQDALRALS